MDKILYETSFESNYLNEIKNSSAEELSEQMIVFVDEYDKYSEKISSLFFKHLGFFVTIIDQSYINNFFSKYNIIFS